MTLIALASTPLPPLLTRSACSPSPSTTMLLRLLPPFDTGAEAFDSRMEPRLMLPYAEMPDPTERRDRKVLVLLPRVVVLSFLSRGPPGLGLPPPSE